MANLLTEPQDDVQIVRFTASKIASTEEAENVSAELSEVLDTGPTKLLLDFQGVEFISSTFLGELFRLNRICRGKGVTLRLCNLSPDLSKVAMTIRLPHIMNIHPNLADALTAFSQQE
jgi:anti-sigma B factor antagonist